MARQGKERLDRRCVALGLAASRQRAQALILAGQVLVNGEVQTKASAMVSEEATLELKTPDHPYVSRGGLKLEAALEHFDLDVSGKVALDVGASTGGFTDCLLQRGARHVIAVDVGYGQLAWKLRQDPRVTCVERCNARHLEPERLRGALKGRTEGQPWPPDLGVIDVSFISLTLVLPAVSRVLGPTRPLVALVKPQFEAPRSDVGKGGVVRDPERRRAAVERVLRWARDQGYQTRETLPSPVPGPKGNVEQLALLITPDRGTSPD
jgi:23S rRNA (cytidine1920-2'-O)/16S rRNA (cytidine1409-2'-O)-methyltransferase